MVWLYAAYSACYALRGLKCKRTFIVTDFILLQFMVSFFANTPVHTPDPLRLCRNPFKTDLTQKSRLRHADVRVTTYTAVCRMSCASNDAKRGFVGG